jgi:hypothetical protein
MYGGGIVWEKPANAKDSIMSDENSSFFMFDTIESGKNTLQIVQ